MSDASSSGVNGSPGVRGVSKRAESGLRYMMVEEARRRCASMFEAYASCTSTTFFLAVPWSCRGDLDALNACLHRYTTDTVLDEYKRRWIAAGAPNDFKEALKKVASS